MITLHRLGHAAEPFHLNPDLIVTVEANPDTVVTLTTGTKIVVAEPPDRVVGQIREFRVDVLAGALERRREEGGPQPHAVMARRAAKGLLVAVDRGSSEDDADGEGHGSASP